MAFEKDPLHKIYIWNVELRIVFVFPDMLGVRDRIQDVFFIEESADPSVGWLLLGRCEEEELLCEVLESWTDGDAQYVTGGGRCSRDAYLLGHSLYEHHRDFFLKLWKRIRKSVTGLKMPSVRMI